jgi:hypothetical protein
VPRGEISNVRALNEVANFVGGLAALQFVDLITGRAMPRAAGHVLDKRLPETSVFPGRPLPVGCALVQRLAAEFDALDAEHVLPVRLITHDHGKHPLGLMTATEELDHLLDFGTNDSPHDHRKLRIVQVQAPVYWPKVRCPSLSLARPPRAAVRSNDVSLDTSVQSLPMGEAHVQLPSRLAIIRSAWDEDLELM